MDQPVAVVLVVFGGGVEPGGGLSPVSAARVRAAADYVARHAVAFGAATAPRIVFTGGWAEASRGAPEPPAGHREGDLMLRAAAALGLGRYATLSAESRSRSTLENLLNVAADGLLAGPELSPAHPLGLVSHAWHLPRVRFLAGRVLGLSGAALRDVPVTSGDLSPTGLAPRLLHAATRLGYLSVRRPDRMLRRERRVISLARRLGGFRRG